VKEFELSKLYEWNYSPNDISLTLFHDNTAVELVLQTTLVPTRRVDFFPTCSQ
jgi:hypothetical protein